jgi:hypothetical protein
LGGVYDVQAATGAPPKHRASPKGVGLRGAFQEISFLAA